MGSRRDTDGTVTHFTEKPTLRLIPTLTLALAALAAAVAPAAAQSGPLRIGTGVIPSNPDPAFDTHRLALFAYNQMFDTLAVADDNA